MALPDFVLRGIVAELDGDIEALRTCSLLSRAWLPLAYDLLFNRLVIESHKRVQDFLDMLDEQPCAFAKHVEVLVLLTPKTSKNKIALRKQDMVLIAATLSRLGSLAMNDVCWIRPESLARRAEEQMAVTTIAGHNNHVNRVTLLNLSIVGIMAVILTDESEESLLDSTHGMNMTRQDFLDILSPFEHIRNLELHHESQLLDFLEGDASTAPAHPKSVWQPSPPTVEFVWLCPSQVSANMISWFSGLAVLRNSVCRFGVGYTARSLDSLRTLKKVLQRRQLAINELGVILQLPYIYADPKPSSVALMLPLAGYRSLNTLGFTIILNQPDILDAKWQWAVMLETLGQFSSRGNRKLRKFELFLGWDKEDVPSLVQITKRLAWRKLVQILGTRFAGRLSVGWEVEHYDHNERLQENGPDEPLRERMRALRDVVKDRLRPLESYNITVKEEWQCLTASRGSGCQ